MSRLESGLYFVNCTKVYYLTHFAATEPGLLPDTIQEVVTMCVGSLVCTGEIAARRAGRVRTFAMISWLSICGAEGLVDSSMVVGFHESGDVHGVWVAPKCRGDVRWLGRSSA
jgi:hypothetical protein